MRPFSISEKCKALQDTYPQPTVLGDAIKGVAHLELLAVLSCGFRRVFRTLSGRIQCCTK
jgi:hypothetical protein